MLIGEKGIKKLLRSKVIVFGVGGVGSFVVEALARAGVGYLVLVDPDMIEVTNINRQLPALFSTVGKYKVDVLKDRIRDINPQAVVEIFREEVTAENVNGYIESNISYVVDAIDAVKSKLAIIEESLNINIPIISAMGAGNRLDPSKFKIGDISETSCCPLARIMRKELRKRGIESGIKVVYSTEIPVNTFLSNDSVEEEIDNKSKSIRQITSISFMPSVAGLLMAGCVVNDLLNN